jgi:hypothetical protein
MPSVLKSGSLNLLKTFRLFQACNWIALALPVSISWAKQPGRGADCTSLSNVEVKERVALYIYWLYCLSLPAV